MSHEPAGRVAGPCRPSEGASVIQAVVAGAAGRMGRRLVALLKESGDFQLAGAVERRDHPDVGRDAGEVAGIGHAGVPIADAIDKALRGAQVVLDFTAPGAAMQDVEAASRGGRACAACAKGCFPHLSAGYQKFRAAISK